MRVRRFVTKVTAKGARSARSPDVGAERRRRSSGVVKEMLRNALSRARHLGLGDFLVMASAKGASIWIHGCGWKC